MNDKDSRMTERFGIDPTLKHKLDNQEIHSIEEFLITLWKIKECSASIYYYNPRAYAPKVKKTPSSITIIVCSNEHPSDCKLQLAISIEKSIKGDYDKLPNLNASDDELFSSMKKVISNQEAQDGKRLMEWLFEEYGIK